MCGLGCVFVLSWIGSDDFGGGRRASRKVGKVLGGESLPLWCSCSLLIVSVIRNNTPCVPVTRLPDKLILCIFQLALKLLPHSSSSPHQFRTSLLLRFSLVFAASRHWAQLELFQNPHVNSPRQIKLLYNTLLQRYDLACSVTTLHMKLEGSIEEVAEAPRLLFECVKLQKVVLEGPAVIPAASLTVASMNTPCTSLVALLLRDEALFTGHRSQ